eukprot:3966654-Prymnesium_polylepis.2
MPPLPADRLAIDRGAVATRGAPRLARAHEGPRTASDGAGGARGRARARIIGRRGPRRGRGLRVGGPRPRGVVAVGARAPPEPAVRVHAAAGTEARAGCGWRPAVAAAAPRDSVPRAAQPHALVGAQGGDVPRAPARGRHRRRAALAGARAAQRGARRLRAPLAAAAVARGGKLVARYRRPGAFAGWRCRRVCRGRRDVGHAAVLQLGGPAPEQSLCPRQPSGERRKHPSSRNQPSSQTHALGGT